MKSLTVGHFSTGAKSIELTHEGKVVFSEGKKLLKLAEQKLTLISQKIGKGSLRIGFSPTLAGELLNAVLPEFSKKYPDIRIHLSDLSSSKMRDALVADELDLIIEEQGDSHPIEWMDLYTLKRSFAVHPEHPFYGYAEIRATEINSQHLLLYSRHDYPSFWRDVTRYFKDNNINAKVVAELDGLESMIVALQAGLGIGVISNKSSLPSEIKRIQASPEIAPIYAGIGLHSYANSPAHVQEFIEMIQASAMRYSKTFEQVLNGMKRFDLIGFREI